MNLLIGALIEGFCYLPLALGVALSLRLLDVLDLTVDGAFGLGAATVAALLVQGTNPILATLVALLAGVLAGIVTSAIHLGFRVNPSLAGVLTTTGLYSVMILVMGSGNLSIASQHTLVNLMEGVSERWLGLPATITVAGTAVDRQAVASLIGSVLVAVGCTAGIGWLLTTELGLALRAAGGNPRMARSVAIRVPAMIVLGLALANGLVALSGALFAQFLGFANVQLGIGAIVTGLATLLMGETLVGRRPLGRWVAGILIGAVSYRLAIALAIRLGLDAALLKLISAALVLAVLAIPRIAALFRGRRPEATGHA